MSSDVQEIIAYLDELECEMDVVGLEAGTLAQYLTYGLQAAGFEVGDDVVGMRLRQFAPSVGDEVGVRFSRLLLFDPGSGARIPT